MTIEYDNEKQQPSNDEKEGFFEKLDKGVKKATEIVEEAGKQILAAKQKDLETIAKQYNDDTDKKILQFEKEGLTYIGGHLIAKLDKTDLPESKEELLLKLDLYFQNKDQKIILKSTGSRLPTYKLTPKSLEDLSNGQEIKFAVEAPHKS